MKHQSQKTNENEYEALDRLARGITAEKLKPMTTEQRQRWEAAKRGRPRKVPGEKAIPTLITVEPKLLKKVDAYAKKTGISRSKLFADAVRRLVSTVSK